MLTQEAWVLPHSLPPPPDTPGLEINFPLVERGFPIYHKPELSLSPSPGGADLEMTGGS